MNIWGRILRLFSWEVCVTAPQRDKCVICVAPHTSNWDFVAGLFAYRSLGRKANFLIKESWFFFPLNYLFRHFGGIPVPKQNSGSHLTEDIIRMFGEREYLNLAVTPEGTRKAECKWRTGFLYIAKGAGVPIQLGIIDYLQRRVTIKDEFWPTGDVEADMREIKEYYKQYRDAAYYPEKFEV